MSTENKQTLFEFRTLRVPQLIEDAEKDLFFAQMPHPELSYFITEMASIPGGTTKKAYLATKATAFFSGTMSDAFTLEDLKTSYPDYVAFGKYLMSNRKTLTHTALGTEVTALPTYDDDDATTLWDSFFYQVITSNSGPLRQALLEVLLGLHVQQKYASIAATDEAARKLASSTIVLPAELFSADHDYENSTNNSPVVSGTHLFNQHLELAESNLQVHRLQQALNEVRTYRADYHRTQTTAEATALKTYNASIEAFVKSMRLDPTIDPDDAPVYSFSKAPEIDEDAFGENLSEEAVNTIVNNDLLKCKSFNDMEKELAEKIKSFQDKAFAATGFFNDKLAVDGTVLPKGCSNGKSSLAPFSYSIKVVELWEKNYSFILAINVGSPCLKLEACSFYLESDETEIASQKFKATNKDGIMTILFNEGNPFYTTDLYASTMLLNLTFDNGLILSINLEDLTFAATPFVSIASPSSTESTYSRLFAPSGHGITRLGVADYHKVEQTLCCYVPGEVSHIENIMAREYKERNTRRLRRTEDTTTTSKSRESERQTDTTTTTRYELQREISEVLTENMERSTDVNSSSNLGASKGFGDNNSVTFDTSFDVSSNFANSTSQENSVTESVNFAKEVTQKALDRIVSKVSEERVIKIIEEFEEQNRHGFDNRQGAEHISGVYRWVDKVYKNTLRTYRNRAIYEFMIPEPASFHMMAKTAAGNAAESFPVREPMDPRTQSFGLLTPITHAALINESNYQQWAAAYGAEVAPPPDQNVVIGKTIASTLDPEQWNKSQSVADEIRLPEGYGLSRIFVNCLGQVEKATPSNWARFYVAAAGIPRIMWAASSTWHERHLLADLSTNPELSRFTDSVPVGAQFTGVEGGMVSYELELVRKPSHFAQWQLDTYNQIIQAYEDRLQDYRDALAEVEVKRAALLADNPMYFRQIEKTVLKKNCIAYMIGHLNMGKI